MDGHDKIQAVSPPRFIFHEELIENTRERLPSFAEAQQATFEMASASPSHTSYEVVGNEEMHDGNDEKQSGGGLR
jgi:hypothetical protein